jgi:Ca2+-transporting ATPase
MTSATTAALQSATDPVATGVDRVAHELGVDPARGLAGEEVRRRLASHGPNQLAARKKEPAWRAFVRQYEDFMQVILLGAAVVNQLATQETGTTVVLAGLTVFNAIIGLRQEAKAEESVKALAQMMKTVARVRREFG